MWWRKAADLGDADAMARLGTSCYAGEGVSQDYEQALKWFQKAADLGNAGAMAGLGLMYGNGRGMFQDFVEAYAWFTVAKASSDKVSDTICKNVANPMTPEQIAEGQKRSRDIRNKEKHASELKYRKKHGQGPHIFPDGRKYVGEWKDGEYLGQKT